VSRYIFRRLIMALIVVWGVSTVAFILMHLGGDPVSLLVSPDAPPSVIDDLRSKLGLDQPLYVQYYRFFQRIIFGLDFGDSIRQGMDAFTLVVNRLPATMELAIGALLVSVVIGIPIGIVAALRRGTFLEVITMGVALFGQSLPVFWTGLMAMLVFGVVLRWLPISGRGSLLHLVLPVGVLASQRIARVTRLLRSSMLEQLGEDYIRTARAKGLSGLAVVYRHALRNAAAPVVTFYALDFARMLGGTIIIETVFAWPGMGLLAVNAVFHRDFPIVQAVVFMMGIVFSLVFFLVDLIYACLDPRIRFE